MVFQLKKLGKSHAFHGSSVTTQIIHFLNQLKQSEK